MTALAMAMPDDMAEDMMEGEAYDTAQEGTAPKGLSDDEILSLLEAERQSSIGFENGVELEKKRRIALEYMKGEMKDVPSIANRSRAVSPDIAAAIETVLPDIMDVLMGGEDVAVFVPRGEEDVEAARQETDYVSFVLDTLRPSGWLLAYTAVKNALMVDTGIIETYWQDRQEIEEEALQGVSALQIEQMVQSGVEIVSAFQSGVSTEMREAPADQAENAGEMAGVAPQPEPQMQTAELPLFDCTIRRTVDRGAIRCEAIDPMNLSVAQDAVITDIEAAPYVVVRSFPRAQALIDQGFPAEEVEKLPAYSMKSPNDQTDQARDLAGETTSLGVGAGDRSGSSDFEGKSLMRTVEVHKHWVRADLEGQGRSQLWRIQTDSACTVILDKRKVDRIGLAVGTPFIQPHRFYGFSLAEKLVEIQKIKTALLRLMLDSGYFAMNQRMEVSEQQASENTLKDLMRNEPGMPVRSKTGAAVRPITAGQLGFDVNLAMEYVATLGEQQTGVVRNAQGLAPDTLHDTAKGAMTLMSMAQKRTRMMARVLAETLFKKWYLDIHALSRQHATRADKIRLGGKFVEVDPSEFGDRADMMIEVGVGAGGKDQKLAVLDRILQFQEKILLNGGPIATWRNVYDAVISFSQTGGFKGAERLFTDPDKAEPREPAPNPDMEKLKAEMQLNQQKHADTMQLEQAKLASSAQTEAQKHQHEVQLRMAELESNERTRRYQIDQELSLKREQLAAELEIKRQEAANRAMLGRSPLAGGAVTSGVHIGGQPG